MGRNWSTQQLVEFLAVVSSFGEEDAATRGGAERAAEALEAEVAAVVRDGRVVSSVGFPAGQVPEQELLEVARGTRRDIGVPGLGMCEAVSAPLDDSVPGTLIASRCDGGFNSEELDLLRGMGRVLGLNLGMIRALESLQGRQRLLETLSGIQRRISRRAPLTDVLQAVVDGASRLLGDPVASVRLVEQDDPSMMAIVAHTGMSDEQMEQLRRSPVGEGAGGRAIAEARVVVTNDYGEMPGALAPFADRGLHAAIAAPVHDSGRTVGALVIASYDGERRYGPVEQETLVAFAEHASLAVTDAKLADALVHQALHDSLTGLPNRSLFMDRLGHCLARSTRGMNHAAVLYIDVDAFKSVNDSLGHAAGDELLMTVAARLDSSVRPGDTVARLGGDEFVVLLEEVESPHEASRVAERVLEELRKPCTLHGQELIVTASIGIATGFEGAAELVRNADVAMYRAKSTGKGRYELFEPGMRDRIVERVTLERHLRRALECDELALAYQPIVRLDTGEIVSVEALARWTDPELGVVPPNRFIPVAEEAGLILPLGSWVLTQAVRQAAGWRARLGDSAPTVNVNVSGIELQQADVVARVRDTLAEEGLPPASLVVEVTETVLMDDSEHVRATLAGLRDIGVQIAVDDFGTGYSSLQFLSRFPIDVLKIPKPFVDDVDSPSGSSALARAIIDLAQNFSLRTVAEGIEQPGQANTLRDLGCSWGQGYHFARPVDSDALGDLLYGGAPEAASPQM
ncbi:MAG: putative bifunctional diguanylate cyclase/phosphodiesterase [Thermoleophilaceae bacterium]